MIFYATLKHDPDTYIKLDVEDETQAGQVMEANYHGKWNMIFRSDAFDPERYSKGCKETHKLKSI